MDKNNEREVLATKEADLEDPAELMKRWPTAQAFIDAHPEEYFESNEPVPSLHLAYAVDLLTDALAGEAVEPVQVEVRNDEPVAWGLLSIQEPELTNSAELAAYWSRKGRVVTPLYAAPTAGVSIVEWLNSIDADGYRTDQERMAARILAKIAPSAALATSPAPSVKQEAGNGALAAIGKLIAAQDNRCTDQPMFIVQQRSRIYGFDSDYCDNIIWLCSDDDYSEANEEEASALEAEYQETGRAKSGWTRTGYMDQWEFVTACFTEKGCKDHLARDGHNLKEPRIYAEGSYRNEEFRTVRNWLISLAAPSARQGEVKVPEGFALVPKDPTPEMVHAARFYSGELPTTAATCYRAMISAAPAPSVMDGEKK